MKEWLSAQEIAAAGLPHTPSTKRGVNELAEREGWNVDEFRCRKRAGRGGGMEYHIQLLPSLAQLAYKRAHIRIGSPAMPAAANDEASPPALANLSTAAREERDARLAILRAYDVFAVGARLNKGATRDLFVMRYNAGSLAVEVWVRERVKRISIRSLARWKDEAKKDTSRLAVDKSANRKGKGVIETANGGSVRLFVLAILVQQPHASADHIVEQLQGEYPDGLTIVRKGETVTVEIPPVRTIQDAVRKLKIENEVVLTKMTDPDLFKSTLKVAGVGALRHITEPNQLWQIDASPIDALCTDGRKTIYVCIDIATRRQILYVSDTPRAAAVGLLIRKAVLAWGTPDRIKTDNGSDFKAKATVRLLEALGIEVEVSDAYSPEQKGHVERGIRTFQHDLTPLLPGYVGHSVADRKAIEGRKSFAARLGQDDASLFGVALTGAELQAHADAWADQKYAHRPHAGLKGKTPFAVAAAGRHTVRKVDERALDILLMPAAGKDGSRTVQKFGVRIDGFYYLNGSILPGRQVFVRMDPNDLGVVHLFDAADGRYLDLAVCPERRGIDGATWTKVQRELQAETIAAIEAPLKAALKSISKTSLIERARRVWQANQPNVVPLPRPEVDHVTPEITAALEAATRDDAKPSAPTGRHAEIHAQLQAEHQAPAPVATVTTMRETPRIRFRRALALEQAMGRGEPIGADDAHWLGGYQQSPEYRGQKAVHEDFAIGH